MTELKAGLPVAVRQLFSFIAVAASEIVTVKFKFFIHFLLEVFPRNLLRSSMDS